MADSLIQVLERADFDDSTRLHIITDITENQNDPDLREKYAKMMVKEATKKGRQDFVSRGYLHLGQAHRIKGNFDESIDALMRALELAKKQNDNHEACRILSALGDTYSVSGKNRQAIKRYKEGIDMVGESDSTTLAIILNNLGDTYFMLEAYDSALICFLQSKSIRENLDNDPSGMAYNMGNIGLVEAALGDLNKAEQDIGFAIKEFEKLQDYYASAVFLGLMADVYFKNKRFAKAMSFADSSLLISKKYGLKVETRDNLLRLANFHENMADYEKAYDFHKQYVIIKDDIASEEAHARIVNLETEMALAKKQSEVEVLTFQKHNQQIAIISVSAVLVFLVVLTIFIYRFYLSKSRLSKTLEEQKSALERLNATKDKFFSIISHDLRGPVTSFMGVSRMIRQLVERKRTDQLIDVADEVEVSVDRLSSLLDNLLNWALQQQGHFPNVPEKVNLNNLVTNILDMFLTMASSKKMRLFAKIDEQIDLWVDRNMMQTIVRNLVNNALKFTEEGGEVSVEALSGEDHAEIRIKDSGVGIPKERLNGLFKLYSKATTYGTEGEKGLGVGLQLVSEFITLNNGSIDVSSEEGEGTLFTICLPLFESSSVNQGMNNFAEK